VVVSLSDWCLCKNGRLIDLSDDAFRQLAPLSVGVLRVTITRAVLPELPPTDTE
jgi:rare lipoprotein A (peptidoglycan hydrolase)